MINSKFVGDTNGKDKNLGEEIKKTHTCQPLKVKNQAALD